MILGDTKKPSFKVSKNDNYNTPVEAWEFLLNNMQQEANFKKRMLQSISSSLL